VRGIVLKGNGLTEVVPELWPIALFLLVVTVAGLILYRETLD
jgi:ABC-2 type transport system permease protein